MHYTTTYCNDRSAGDEISLKFAQWSVNAAIFQLLLVRICFNRKYNKTTRVRVIWHEINQCTIQKHLFLTRYIQKHFLIQFYVMFYML